MGLLFSISAISEKRHQYSLRVRTGLPFSQLKTESIICFMDLIARSAGSLHWEPGGMKVHSRLNCSSNCNEIDLVSYSVELTSFEAALNADIGSDRTEVGTP